MSSTFITCIRHSVSHFPIVWLTQSSFMEYPVYYAILFAHLLSEALLFSAKVYPSNFSKVGTYKMTCTSCQNHRTNCMTVT
ncbi:hypothetical protein AALO_G00255620, partial [Alosa alosa]